MSCGAVSPISLPSKRDRALARRRQARDRPQRGGLARAVGADHRDDLALVHGQRDALQRLDVAVVGVDVLDLEQRHQPVAAWVAEVGLDDAVVVADLLGQPLGDLLAVVEHGDVLGHAHHDLHVVLDQEDGQPALVAQGGHELGQPRGLVGVHAGGGLVEQQQRRVAGQRAGDLDAALVAVGEVDRDLVELATCAGRRSRASRAPSRARASPPCGPPGCAGSSRTRPPSCVRAGRPSRSRPRSWSRTGGCSGTCAPRPGP